MDLSTRYVMCQAARLVRKANRRRRRQLAAELASYTSDADLIDLYALLDAYPDGQTSEIREILGRQQIQRMRGAKRVW
jgi:hypothetical protein